MQIYRNDTHKHRCPNQSIVNLTDQITEAITALLNHKRKIKHKRWK